MKGKKMKSKIGFLGITLLLVSGAFAAGQDIKDAPDGAAIKLFPDGGYQITAVGTGVYDFNFLLAAFAERGYSLCAGEYWTLNMCEWSGCPEECRSEDGVAGLSDILETTGEHLRKYCLSLKACAGILRRAASRGKDLPERLAAALKVQIARFLRTRTAET